MVFYPGEFTIAWVAMTLKTISSEHRDLRNVSFRCDGFYNFGGRSVNARKVVGEELYGQWMDLDRALVQLWELLAVPMKISYYSRGKKKRAHKFVECLLPETTQRGIIKLVDPTYLC